MSDNNKAQANGCAFIIVLIVWLTVSLFKSYAFERVTGHHLSWWDALVLDTRVMATPKGGEK